MTSIASTNPVEAGPEPVGEIHCMEIIGGNETVHRALSGYGLDMWVDSRPHQGDAGGGDIHYFSMCGGGQVTRLALADVAGHGQSVGDMATMLRHFMRKHINQLDQTQFARELNREFGLATSAGRFATAVLMTYFSPTNNLIVVNAGHPRPLWYSARLGSWRLMDEQTPDKGKPLAEETARYHFKRISNLPLGIIDPTDYSQFAVKLDPQDLVLLYTDALIEAANSTGQQLGEQGLLELARSLDRAQPQTIVNQLLEAVDRWREGRAANDDQTLIVIHHNGDNPPPLNLSQTFKTLAKMMGLVKV